MTFYPYDVEAGPVSARKLPSQVKSQHHFLWLMIFTVLSMAFLLFYRAQPPFLTHWRGAAMDVVIPVVDVSTSAYSSVRQFFADLGEIPSLRLRNQELEKELEALQHWKHQATFYKSENAALRNYLNMAPDRERSHITTRIVASSAGPFMKSFVIKGGKRQGIRKGLAVMAADGVVGRVIEAGQTSARVLLLNDFNSRIPAMLESSREHVIVSGNNGPHPVILRYQKVTKVKPGERVITSGKGGVFPPGLVIGTTRAKTWKGKVEIRPYINYDQLEFVHVLHSEKHRAERQKNPL